jgi:hypothetical protein
MSSSSWRSDTLDSHSWASWQGYQSAALCEPESVLEPTSRDGNRGFGGVGKGPNTWLLVSGSRDRVTTERRRSWVPFGPLRMLAQEHMTAYGSRLGSPSYCCICAQSGTAPASPPTLLARSFRASQVKAEEPCCVIPTDCEREPRVKQGRGPSTTTRQSGYLRRPKV